MPSLVLVDTCTLLNFAAVARLDLLEATLDGCGRWTEAAAREIDNAAEQWPCLWSVDLAGWLGDPLAPDRPGDDRAVFQLQRQLGGTRKKPREHLAEAEAIYLIQNHPEFKDAVLLTDDRAAADLAAKRGIEVWLTMNVLSLAYRTGRIGCPEAYNAVQDMVQAGRGVYVPINHELICP